MQQQGSPSQPLHRDERARLARELIETLKGDVRVRHRIERAAAVRSAGSGKLDDMLDRAVGQKTLGGDKRRHKRFGAPRLVVAVGGRKYATVDWSEGGALLGDYNAAVSIGAKHKIAIQFADHDATGEARIIRRNTASRSLAIEFTTLSLEAQQLLERLRKLQHRTRSVAA